MQITSVMYLQSAVSAHLILKLILRGIIIIPILYFQKLRQIQTELSDLNQTGLKLLTSISLPLRQRKVYRIK